MFRIMGQRSVLVAAMMCVGIGASAVVAVQASASGGGAPQPSSPAGLHKPGVLPPVRPLTASGKVSPAVLATNAHCGQVLTASLTLNGDLVCSGSGLTIAGDKVVLNLNGHEISGPGQNIGQGVTVSGISDTVENGLVTQFFYGVVVQGTTDTVLNVRATYNGEGIRDIGQGNKITNSVAENSVQFGIVALGSGGTYSGDHEISNGLGSSGYSGLVLAGQKQTVTGNVANDNGDSGIFDQGFGTTLTKNTADFNAQDGIYVQEVAVIDGGGNTAKGNDYRTGIPPEQCYGLVCA